MSVPYVAAVAGASVVTARRLHHREDAVHLPGAFVAMHLGWGLGFWWGLLKRAGRRPADRKLMLADSARAVVG
jgi:hypothetical protein